MAINQQQFALRYEKLKAQGVPEEEAHRQATEYATTVAEATKKAVKPKRRRRSILAEVLTRRGRRELWGGAETYLRESPAERKRRVELEREE